jgi:peptidoglycan-associated lipoprotein
MKSILQIVIIGFVMIGMTGCSLSARIKKADKRYEIGEYYAAGDMYKQLYSKTPSKEKALRAKLAFRQGECFRILNNSRAVAAYKNAIRYQYADSIVYLRYAQALQYQGKYKDAEKQYDLYLQAHPKDYVAMAGKYACQQADTWRKQPSRYKIALAKEFNAKRSSNLSPSFIGTDGDALVFTSNRTERVASKSRKRKTPAGSSVTGADLFNIYSARKNAAGKWEDIQLCEGIIGEASTEENSEDQEGVSIQKQISKAEAGVAHVTADGRAMYFTYSRPTNGQDLGARIYMSNRASGEWSEAQEVKLFSDSSVTIGHPSLNALGDTMYFVSDAPGGFGGKDIYMAISNGSEWDDIRNLGPKINTADDEMFPYIREDGRLYFASKGHPGYGGLDLFYAIPEDTTWSIFNMGAPFNSQGDDFGICFIKDKEEGFFSSNRGQKRGYDMIYSFLLPELEFLVEGTVTDMSGEHMSEASLRLVGNDGTNVKTQIRKDGTYRLKLKKDTDYAMLVTSRGYLNAAHTLTTEGLTDSYTYTKDFSLSPISKPVKMDNIFFKFGSWELTPDSEQGLNTLIKLLNDNPNITIELAAHTDLVGQHTANQELSQKRAQSVVKYLIDHGIEPERLTAVGYGEEKPVVVDAFLHKQHSFLPMNQVLDETFILTLNREQQEVCNALNRRTEFRVLKTTYNLY